VWSVTSACSVGWRSRSAPRWCWLRSASPAALQRRRLYFASVALIAAGLTGWLIDRLTGVWLRRACVILAGGVLAFVAVRLVAIQRVVGPLGVVRRDLIEHGRPGSIVTVPRFPVGASRYFLGEDLTVAAAREVIASDYQLKAIELEPAPTR